MKKLEGYPADHGFYFPAEWEKHQATWLTYPHNTESWNPDELKRAQLEFAEFIRIVGNGEEVKVNMPDSDSKQHLMNLLGCSDNSGRTILYLKESNDCWCRDHGPVFLKNSDNKRKAAIGFSFNGWGEKYDYQLDDAIKWHIIEKEKYDYFLSDIVLEGGSVETNGKDILLTTESCLLNTNRNPHISKQEIEWRLKKYFGVQHIIWLKDGISGDDTDGHIDTISRILPDNRVITVLDDHSGSTDHKILKENYHILQKWVKKGQISDILTLPCPRIVDGQNNPLPASYANYYVCNAGVVVPIFDVKEDDLALKQLEKAFPDRMLFPVISKEIVKGLGSWHCLSQQVPI